MLFKQKVYTQVIYEAFIYGNKILTKINIDLLPSQQTVVSSQMNSSVTCYTMCLNAEPFVTIHKMSYKMERVTQKDFGLSDMCTLLLVYNISLSDEFYMI